MKPDLPRVKGLNYSFNSSGMSERVIAAHVGDVRRALADAFELAPDAIRISHVPRQIDGSDFRLTALVGLNRTDSLAAVMAARYVLPRLRRAQTDPLSWWTPGLNPSDDAEALEAILSGVPCPPTAPGAEPWLRQQLNRHLSPRARASLPAGLCMRLLSLFKGTSTPPYMKAR